jgi:hypothetical protein
LARKLSDLPSVHGGGAVAGSGAAAGRQAASSRMVWLFVISEQFFLV